MLRKSKKHYDSLDEDDTLVQQDLLEQPSTGFQNNLFVHNEEHDDTIEKDFSRYSNIINNILYMYTHNIIKSCKPFFCNSEFV